MVINSGLAQSGPNNLVGMGKFSLAWRKPCCLRCLLHGDWVFSLPPPEVDKSHPTHIDLGAGHTGYTYRAVRVEADGPGLSPRLPEPAAVPRMTHISRHLVFISSPPSPPNTNPWPAKC